MTPKFLAPNLESTNTALPLESPGLNPYATPVALSDDPLADAARIRTPWLLRLIVLQAIVIIAALAVEAFQHETIIASGPVFFLVGLAIAILGFRNHDSAAMAFGGSAIALTLLVVFLINYNSWGPVQADRPISLLLFAYAAFALPISAKLALARSNSEKYKATHTSDGSAGF